MNLNKLLKDLYKTAEIEVKRQYSWIDNYRLMVGINRIQQFMKPYHLYAFEGHYLESISNEIYYYHNDDYTGIHHLNQNQLLYIITHIHSLTAKPELCRECVYVNKLHSNEQNTN